MLKIFFHIQTPNHSSQRKNDPKVVYFEFVSVFLKVSPGQVTNVTH